MLLIRALAFPRNGQGQEQRNGQNHGDKFLFFTQCHDRLSLKVPTPRACSSKRNASKRQVSEAVTKPSQTHTPQPLPQQTVGSGGGFLNCNWPFCSKSCKTTMVSRAACASRISRKINTVCKLRSCLEWLIDWRRAAIFAAKGCPIL